MTGIIFDIQRASYHDGPGIRTTVFLKGCPLRCVWCHNPESYRRKPVLLFSQEKCQMCGACKMACNYDVHSFSEGTHQIDRSQCVLCGDCVEACVYDALEIKGKEMTVDQVFAEIIKDRVFYETSGGGMTLSGGEPLAQPGFSLALLRKCKAEGIQTCVETSGFAAEALFLEFLPEIDVLLFDYKATDPAAHRALTGQTNEQILRNLDLAVQAGKEIYLRCPMVPGVNDTAVHLAGIAALSARYPSIAGIELMSYHNMGAAKNERIGEVALMAELPNATEAQISAWRSQLRALGCDIGGEK